MATLYFEDVKEGDEIPGYAVKAGYMELNRFAGANDEHIPIHMDPDYAVNVAKLPDVIVMGNLKLAYLANALVAWAGPDGWVKKIDVSYRRMDNVNETLTAKGVVKGKRQEGGENLVDVDIWVENGKGEKTTPGSAVVSLPSKG
ncbi:MAG: MaoC/PaaZ C-terminal domain-containing protein [Dehalococcoidia bacterium]